MFISPQMPQAQRLFCCVTLPPPAAQKSISVCHQDWSGIQADFLKRFDTQLKQELSDQGSSITGTALPDSTA